MPTSSHRITQIWPILELLGTPVSTPLTDQGQIWHARVDAKCALTRHILHQILPHFQLQHSLVVVPSSGAETKLNAQLHTFHYQRCQKRFRRSATNVKARAAITFNNRSVIAWWTWGSRPSPENRSTGLRRLHLNDTAGREKYRSIALHMFLFVFHSVSYLSQVFIFVFLSV